MKAHSFFVSNATETLQSIQKARQNGLQATVAVVFSSPAIDYKAICSTLLQENIEVFGCTTAGEISNSEVQEESAAIMLMDMPRAHYRLLGREFSAGAGNLKKVAAELGSEISSNFENSFVLLNVSGLGCDGEEAVHGLRQTAPTVQVIGGLAGDDFQMQSTYIFSNNLITPSGITALVLDKKRFQTVDMATSGWNAVGVEKTITKASGNVVYEIDNEPAIDVFGKYFNLSDNLSSQEIVTKIGVKYPLHLVRPDGSTVLRAPLLGNAEDKSLVFAGGLPQGAKVRFSVAPDLEIVHQTIEHFSVLKPLMQEADALLMYSCKARHLTLGPMIDFEVAGAQEIWGGAPLIGFFSYGEFGTQKDKGLDFHNETCCLVAIREIKD
ncbi:MAG: hypothetical protein EAZ57_01090 [Cytophagales bacterium]|nr:MAG: hypothetical protein EAZ67_00040 [Cytophagales bacterium]TAF62380.1 MAG: hypothetical protein EAZ57_01090 [Cytophagales bacterium]